MIKVSNLKKSYKKNEVVKGINFEVNEGELFALLGSNGAGKSTTIKMILGLVKISEGDITIEKNKKIGYSPETPYFPPFLSAIEVLKYYARLQGIKEPMLTSHCEELLNTVGLDNSKNKVKNYSKGMLQRLALAQALIDDPDILILDEPCAGLDAMGRIEMLSLINKLKKQGKTIIMNSHILNDMEKVLDKGIILNKGEILKSFSKADLEKENDLETIFVETIEGARA